MTGQKPSQPGRRPSWFEKTWSLAELRKRAISRHTPDQIYVLGWLKLEGIVPWNSTFDRVFSAYPLLDKDAITGEHLASLAVEWDQQGPSPIDDWLDMVEFECAGTTKRDFVREALRQASE